MSEQAQEAHRPQDSTIIRVQKLEIDRLNDNRLYLIASLDELQEEAMNQINHLQAENERLLAENLSFKSDANQSPHPEESVTTEA